MTSKQVSLTADRLREILHYDPEAGIFTRIKGVQGCAAGSIAGTVNKKLGYSLIGVDKRTYLAHRLAWLYVHGVWPKDQIDHINGIRSDNRISNLREATIAQNRQNQVEFRRSNSSGYLGVYFDKNSEKYSAKIGYKGTSHHVGVFDTGEEAHEAYRHEKLMVHPFGTLAPSSAKTPEKSKKFNRTGRTGVQPTKGGRFLAFVTMGGANRSLGAFDCADAALAAHQAANSEIERIGVDAWVKMHDMKSVANANSSRKSSIGLAGVEFVKGKKSDRYAARIKIDGVRVYLGLFDSAQEASAAYLKVKADHFERKTGENQA